MTSAPENGDASGDRAAYERWSEFADPFWDEAEGWSQDAWSAEAED